MSLSPPLPLVLEVMEEAEADCALAFAEAQRWVEVSAFTPLLSARLGGLAAAFSRLPDLSWRSASGWFAQQFGGLCEFCASYDLTSSEA